MNRRTVLAGMGLSAAALAVVTSARPRSARAQTTWTPPIGIPDPGFGVTTPVAAPIPNPWSGNVSRFYYVQSGGGNTGNGYPGNPRATIPNPIPAGAVVIMGNGANYAKNHVGGGRLVAQGTASSPCLIRSLDPAARATLQSDLEFAGTYLVLEHLNFRIGIGEPLWLSGGGTASHHVCVRHCDISGTSGQGGIAITAQYSGGTLTDVVVHDCIIHDNGDWQATFDQDRHGIGIHAVRVWVLDSTFYHNSGDGIQINAGQSSSPDARFIYIGRCVAYENKQNGFWSKGAQDVIMSQNTVYTHRPSDSSPGAGMGQQYGPDRVWYLFNHIYDCDFGIVVAGDSQDPVGAEGFIIGNVIHNIVGGASSNGWGAAAVHLRGNQMWTVANNTLNDIPSGIENVQTGTLIAENNIISGLRNFNGEETHIVAWGSKIGQAVCRNNLFGPGATAFRVRWNGTLYTSLSSFQRTTGKGQGCLVAAPRFLDAANDDLRLTAASPAVNAGVESAAYARFQALYAIDIRRDFADVIRPQGRGWDIGAFVVAGAAPRPSRAGPLNLTVRSKRSTGREAPALVGRWLPPPSCDPDARRYGTLRRSR